MTFVTDFADQAVVLPVVLAIAALLAAQGWRWVAAAWLLVTGATFGAVLALKLACLACPNAFTPLHLFSPSGHTAAATLLAGGLTLLLGASRRLVLPVAGFAAVGIGSTRLALHVHTVPEVLVGAMLGLAGITALLLLAGAPPRLRPARLLGVVALVAILFHGFHLPAEAAIRRAAWHAERWLPTACRVHFVDRAASGDQVRP